MRKSESAVRPGVALLAGFFFIFLAAGAHAQTAQSTHAFKMSMETKIGRIESRIDRMRRDLDPDGSSGGGRGSGTATTAQNTSALYELDRLEEALEEASRELNSTMMMASSSDYEMRRRQANFEYYIESIDRRLWEITAQLNRAEKDEAQAQEEREEKEALEEEIANDEDWAEQWASGED